MDVQHIAPMLSGKNRWDYKNIPPKRHQKHNKCITIALTFERKDVGLHQSPLQGCARCVTMRTRPTSDAGLVCVRRTERSCVYLVAVLSSEATPEKLRDPRIHETLAGWICIDACLCVGVSCKICVDPAGGRVLLVLLEHPARWTAAEILSTSHVHRVGVGRDLVALPRTVRSHQGRERHAACAGVPRSSRGRLGAHREAPNGKHAPVRLGGQNGHLLSAMLLGEIEGVENILPCACAVTNTSDITLGHGRNDNEAVQVASLLRLFLRKT